MGILIENFKKMYEEFSDMDYFDLDNIAEFYARELLASSSGYTGDEALRRSYQIKDDSRKSMKMQAKSYAELFRALGWITSAETALRFNFTLLGMHIALVDKASKSLFEQCLLGIEYPNHILDVKFRDINKPFVNMINFAHRLDGIINRDEILLGPMNLNDGYSSEEQEERINFIKAIRVTQSMEALDEAIEQLAEENGMKPNSVRNLTRFVMSSLCFAGWFKKENRNIYGSNSVFLVLTEKGQLVADVIGSSINIRGESIDIESAEDVKLVELSLLYMFKRANLDVDNELKEYEDLIKDICTDKGYSGILFSPYQFFSGSELKEILPQYTLETSRKHELVEILTEERSEVVTPDTIVEAKDTELSKDERIKEMLLLRISNVADNLDGAVATFLSEIKIMKQSDFYPLVADLLGFVFERDAYAPSAGNNNMRYDVIIPDDQYSIPVEVKSPTEEEMLSVKAIRQALENKVILLARKPYTTTYDVSSFACGFKVPNKRSDVYKLIMEIYETYKINISILDIETLIKAAFYCAKNDISYELSEFKGHRGVIKFEGV